MGWSIRTTLGNKIDQEKEISGTAYVSYWRAVVEWIACAASSAGEEFALSVLKCGDDGGCVWTIT